MIQFYVSIIVIGILLVLTALVWIAYDTKKSRDVQKKLDDTKEELVSIINDAEQMVEEMNKFSDYIATQMEIKNEELNSCLKSIEDRIKQVNSKVEVQYGVKDVKIDRVVNGNTDSPRAVNEKSPLNYSRDVVVENYNYENANIVYSQINRIQSKMKEKVIPMNGRHKEVIMLAKSGLSDTDIAKRMNMGKGEIQLILEMNRN